MTNEDKRTVSMIVFSLAGLCGVWGCVALPGAIFTLGENDSTPERWALLLPATLLPACFTALWFRKPASMWLVFLGLLWMYGMSAQKHYMESVRHFPKESLWSLVLGDFFWAYLVIGLGLFGLYGEFRKWPRIVNRPDKLVQ